jgi:tyrosinase
MFYMHHTNLDRVWWSWQKKNLPARLADISGPINILDYDNVIGGNVTLAFPLTLGYNAADVTIGDVMDIRGDTLCYTYDHVYT